MCSLTSFSLVKIHLGLEARYQLRRRTPEQAVRFEPWQGYTLTVPGILKLGVTLRYTSIASRGRNWDEHWPRGSPGPKQVKN